MVRVAWIKGVTAIVVASILTGCGPQVKVQTAPVRGTITVNGQPRKGIIVAFWPEPMSRPSMAGTDAAGRYVAQFTPEQKGVVVGTCKVNFSIAQDDGSQIPLPATADGKELRLDIGKDGLVFDHDIKYDGTLP